MSPANLVGGGVSTGQLADHNSDSVVYSVAQLSLDTTVVCQKPVVPHWDCSRIHLLYSTILIYTFLIHSLSSLSSNQDL